MAVVPTKGPKACNMVKNSEIWKAHVGKEDKTCRQWNKGWGFLVDHYQQLAEELQEVNDQFAMQCDENMIVRSPSPSLSGRGQRPQTRSRRYSQPAVSMSQAHAAQKDDTVLKLPAIDPKYKAAESTRSVAPPSRHHHRSLSMPVQASAAVGWQSTVPSTLEIYHGPYQPKGDLVKIFHWPREGLPNP
ncbi:uncharacterized protein LOC135813586 [Sycon ciliatum]|uniref:uncharacterized protein LOC135813586 n=1 Tax=Sycon ciliatum TaxID=27933 RepID=UPI0031F681CB